MSIIFNDKKLDAEQPKSYKQWRDKQRTQVVPVNSIERNAIGAKNKFVKFDCGDRSDSEQPRQNVPTYTAAPFIDANSCRMNPIVSNECRTTNGNMNGIDINQNAAVRRDHPPTDTLSMARSDDHRPTATNYSTPSEAAISVSKPTITMEDMYRLMSLQQRMEANECRNAPNVQSSQPSNASPAEQEITLNDIFQLLLQTQQQPQQQPQQQHQMQPPPQPITIVPTPVQTFSQPVTVAKEVPMELTRPQDGEPSLKDLFHIIVKQQEQLLNIQKQVQAILVQNTNHSPYIDHHRSICDAYNQFNATPNPMGVMTSLEINVQKYSHNKKSPPDRKLMPSSNDRENKENMLQQCCTNCRSPLNQNAPEKMIVLDERAAEQQNSSPNSDQNNRNDWAIYGNILNQVNHVLKNSPPPNADHNRPFHNGQMSRQPIAQHHPDSSNPSSASSTPNCNEFEPTPSHIRSAQFQQIGLKFDDVNVSATSKR